MNDWEGFVNNISQDNARNSTGYLCKFGGQVAFAEVVTIALFVKNQGNQTEEDSKSGGQDKEVSCKKADVIDVLNKIKAAGAEPFVTMKDSKTMLKCILAIKVPSQKILL